MHNLLQKYEWVTREEDSVESAFERVVSDVLDGGDAEETAEAFRRIRKKRPPVKGNLWGHPVVM